MLFLFRFWPIIIPGLMYFLWLTWVQNTARKKGEPVPVFRTDHIYWLAIATLLTALICFMILGFSNSENKGIYVPSHMENGVVVPPMVKH